jgi:guanylate cyclase
MSAEQPSDQKPLIAETFWTGTFDRLEKVGAPKVITFEDRVNRGVMSVLVLMSFFGSIVWGVLYASQGNSAAAFSALSYTVLTAVNLILFAKVHHNEEAASLIQLIMVMLAPFAVMVSLGGFFNSSVVILWSLLGPMAGLLVFGRRAAVLLFATYVLLGIGGAILPAYFPEPADLPTVIIQIFFILNVSVPTLCAFLLLVFFVAENRRAQSLLADERDKSEGLLLNVLPQAIADRLKESDEQIAEHFDEVSVMFADVVGFTPLSAQMAPRETVDILNEIFSYFDSMADRFGVEKIRTIGDGYMAAAGAPLPMAEHAEAIVGMAVEMCKYMTERHSEDPQLRMRIGINTGSAVGGIVGNTKFHYDLWGDAVNIAARMESHGIPGKIQLAPATYERIKDKFPCVSRGLIDIRGRGSMETWLLGPDGQTTA